MALLLWQHTGPHGWLGLPSALPCCHNTQVPTMTMSGADSAGDGRDSTPPPSLSNFSIQTGDLLLATEQFIVHQCNCVSRHPKGLSKTLFSAFGHADVYRELHARGTLSIPGTITVRGHSNQGPHQQQRGIINLHAQRRAGRPAAAGGDDSAAMREGWFREAMERVGREVTPLHSLALPARIGCGLGGGDWHRYQRIIRDFCARHPAVRVVIYERDGPVGSGSGGGGGAGGSPLIMRPVQRPPAAGAGTAVAAAASAAPSSALADVTLAAAEPG
eukprot:COSAG01_NODE_9240_length_2509_cov_1.321162_2_plen_273_part_01